MSELTTTQETKELATDSPFNLFAASNFEDAYRMAKLIASSELVPPLYRDKPANVLLAIEYGRRLNIGELQALQNIAVVNGKPCIYADGLLAVCQTHPHFVSIYEEPVYNEKGSQDGAMCRVIRKNYEKPVERVFTIDDAKRAELWGRKGPWTQYPKRMLQMRARSWALRDAFADALSGVQVREEVEDYQIKEINPKPAKAHDAESRLGSILQAEQ